MFACCRNAFGGPGEEVNELYPVRPDFQQTVPVTRFKAKAGKTLSSRKWNSLFSEEGFLDIEKALRRIQSGGVHPSIKGVVWEFLLGCYDPKSTHDERNAIRQSRRDKYGRLKSECQGLDPNVGSGRVISAPVISEDGKPVQESLPNQDLDNSKELEQKIDAPPLDERVVEWKLTLHQIGLDVLRTDRTLVYYESQDHLARLWDLLAVYSWIDKDVGYCQGMTDLCSPISILIESEADAFWCFERLMRRVRENFKCTVGSIGVRSQLSVLSAIINAVDPNLHKHLEELDGGEYLFAFRMLMVLFRREFSFVDTMYLWELIWAMEYNPNLFSSYEESSETSSQLKGDDKTLKLCGKFEKKNMQAGQDSMQATLSIFVMASVLETRSQQLLNEAKGLDDVVKILNDITGNMDAKLTCREALKIHAKYLQKVKTS